MTVLEPMTYDTYGGVRDVKRKEWGDVKYIMELNRFNNYSRLLNINRIFFLLFIGNTIANIFMHMMFCFCLIIST